jgi:glycosyltransferase involved in cell wall biosynthesis
MEPLVSCIMPTFDRRPFVAGAIACFERQDYPNRELLVVDDGTDPVRDLVPNSPRIRYVRLARKLVLGSKRNLACQQARGSIIVHWDDDDWSAPWRLRYQVRELQASGAEICGLTRVLYWDEPGSRAFWYDYPGSEPWVAGNTLCYRRERWRRTPFPALSRGEDAAFLSARPHGVKALARDDFMIARLHAANTAPKQLTGPAYSPVR